MKQAEASKPAVAPSRHPITRSDVTIAAGTTVVPRVGFRPPEVLASLLFEDGSLLYFVKVYCIFVKVYCVFVKVYCILCESLLLVRVTASSAAAAAAAAQKRKRKIRQRTWYGLAAFRAAS